MNKAICFTLFLLFLDIDFWFRTPEVLWKKIFMAWR